MPNATTDYARGFRAGIEAAKAVVRTALDAAALAAEQTHDEDAAAGLGEVAARIAQKLEVLKRPEPSEAEKVERLEPFARFWFELGYGACFADAVVKNDCKPPFELTDAIMDRAWEIAPECYDGDILSDQAATLAQMERADG